MSKIDLLYLTHSFSMGICKSNIAQKVNPQEHQRFIEAAETAIRTIVEKKTEIARQTAEHPEREIAVKKTEITPQSAEHPPVKQSAAELARKAAVARHNARVAAQRAAKPDDSAKNGDDDSKFSK